MRNLKAISVVIITLLLLSNLISAQNIVLTFTGQEEGTSNHVSTDSIFIRNVTQGGDTMLIGNDTVLELYYTGISESSFGSNDFELTQNYPNPFSDRTTFAVKTNQKEELFIVARNILGQKLAEYSGVYNSGLHLFLFTGSQNAFYIITVTNGKTAQSIKLINNDQSGSSQHRISYIGYQTGKQSSNNKATFNSTIEGGFVYSLGDQLQYVGFSDGYEMGVIYDIPEASSDYIIEFEFPDTFVCGDLFTDERDGQTYGTVQIGDQCWMTKNMNIGTMVPGADDQQDNGEIEKYCYTNDELNCDEYGGLYQWGELMQYDTLRFNRGICPDGWHVPTLDEWNVLVDFYGGWEYAGTYLKPGGSSGFDALMAGIRTNNLGDHFGLLNESTSFWTSLMSSSDGAWYTTMAEYQGNVDKGAALNVFGYSLRCVKGLPITKDSNVVVIDTTIYNLISDSIELSQGIYKYEYNKKRKAGEIIVGDAIIGITDKGYLRKVNTVDDDPPYLTLETSQATLEDVFIQGDFNTPFNLDSLQQLKSIYSRGTITYLRDGVDLIIKNSGFEYTFVDVEIIDNGNISLYITEGGVLFDPEFEFDFKFKKGVVRRLAFYSDESLLENSIDVELDALYQETIQETITLAHYQHTLGFMIGFVPVWIVVNLDLIAQSNIDIDANFHATTGYTNTNYVTVGMTYKKGEWTKIWDLQQNNYIHPLEYSGAFNLAQHLSIIPSISIELYGVAGPYVNMDLWEEFVFNYVLPSMDVDAAMDIGMNANIGAQATILGYTLASYNHQIIGFDMNIWTMPKELLMESGNNQSAQVNQPLADPVKVKVVDNYGNTFSNIPVHFEITEGGGSLSDYDVMTDVDGYAETYWTMGSVPGDNKLLAKVVRANGIPIVGAPMEFSAIAIAGGGLPSVTTDTVTNITDTTAISGGEVIDEGGYSVTERGICWSLTVSPTIANDTTINGSGLGAFISNLTGLLADTTYYVRAYATNSEGTAYGNEEIFTTLGVGNPGDPCPGTPTVTYEGQIYNTVLIGTQCWLKENLNVGTRIDGILEQTDNGVIEKYCYNNKEDSCDVYGGLYQWDEMMQYSTTQVLQGICPPDWHLPTDEEWKQLEGEVDSQFGYPNQVWNTTGYRGFDAGKQLKSANRWTMSGNGPDNFGFSALPNGYCRYNGYFLNVRSFAYFWSSTEDNSSNAWFHALGNIHDGAGRGNDDREFGFGVRCIKD